MALTLITPPAVEPVTLDDAKAYLRVLINNDDALIGTLVTAARQYVERYLDRQLITATYRQTFDIFPIYSGLQFPFPFFQQLPESAVYQTGNYGYLQTPNYGVLSPPDFTKLTLPNWGMCAMPKPPLQEVVSVQYMDPSGTLQTWDASNYQVVTSNEPGFFKPLVSFPTIMANTSEAVRVTFTAGYGDDGSAVPQPINVAIKLLVGQWYEVRQPTAVGDAIEQAVHALLEPYRFNGFF